MRLEFIYTEVKLTVLMQTEQILSFNNESLTKTFCLAGTSIVGPSTTYSASEQISSSDQLRTPELSSRITFMHSDDLNRFRSLTAQQTLKIIKNPKFSLIL